MAETSAPLAPARIAGLLASTVALLQGETGSLTDAEARWHPAPGQWCVNEVLGHLVESDKRGFVGRITRAIERDRPREAPWDQIAVARERRDCDRMIQSLFMEWMGQRHGAIEMVRSLRDDQLARECVHGKVGVLSVRDLLHEWVHHDRSHTKQILSNVQALVWPHMGNARQFTGE